MATKSQVMLTPEGDNMQQTNEPKVDTSKSGKVEHITIAAPNFESARFTLIGTSPLVIHRMSAKLRQEFEQKQAQGAIPGQSRKKNREAKDSDELYNQARYISQEGWDGFNASALRKASISACRLVNFKMTMAKLSIFVEADGVDETEPQIPLVRIYGESEKQQDMARVETGQPYVTVRAAYHSWIAKPLLQWDADQFRRQDIANLLMRVGRQVGICEGRPDSKNSAGMGWGLFNVE
jgi:hypothetical protein